MGNKSEDARRQDILRIAQRHFLGRGYAGAGMETIAREASISTATLYGLFPGKAELFAAVVAHASEEFTRRVAPVAVPPGDARIRLRAFARAYAGFMADPVVRQIFRLVMAERRRFETVARDFYERGRGEFGQALIGLLDELTTAGELSPHKTSWVAGQLMGMIEHPLFFVPLVTGDEVMPLRGADQVADDAVETLLARYGVAQG